MQIRLFYCRSVIVVAASLALISGCRDRLFDHIYAVNAADLAAVNRIPQAREFLQRATRKVPLPAGAHHISLCQGDSRDTLAYLVFSAKRDEIVQFVEVSLGVPIKEFTLLDSDSGRTLFDANDTTVHRDFAPWREIGNVKTGVFYRGATYSIAVDFEGNTVYFVGG